MIIETDAGAVVNCQYGLTKVVVIEHLILDCLDIPSRMDNTTAFYVFWKDVLSITITSSHQIYTYPLPPNKELAGLVYIV